MLAAFLFLVAGDRLVIAVRRRRYLLAGWLWFLITLLPMIGVVQVGTQAMADRYAYLPFIGLFLMIVWGVADWARHDPFREWRAAAGIAVLLRCRGDASPARLLARQRHVVDAHLEVTRRNYIAEVDLGAALVKRGHSQAMEHFRAATAIDRWIRCNMYIAATRKRRTICPRPSRPTRR